MSHTIEIPGVGEINADQTSHYLQGAMADCELALRALSREIAALNSGGNEATTMYLWTELTHAEALATHGAAILRCAHEALLRAVPAS